MFLLWENRVEMMDGLIDGGEFKKNNEKKL
jgi:hypothetical protein